MGSAQSDTWLLANEISARKSWFLRRAGITQPEKKTAADRGSRWGVGRRIRCDSKFVMSERSAQIAVFLLPVNAQRQATKRAASNDFFFFLHVAPRSAIELSLSRPNMSFAIMSIKLLARTRSQVSSITFYFFFAFFLPGEGDNEPGRARASKTSFGVTNWVSLNATLCGRSPEWVIKSLSLHNSTVSSESNKRRALFCSHFSTRKGAEWSLSSGLLFAETLLMLILFFYLLVHASSFPESFLPLVLRVEKKFVKANKWEFFFRILRPKGGTGEALVVPFKKFIASFTALKRPRQGVRRSLSGGQRIA